MPLHKATRRGKGKDVHSKRPYRPPYLQPAKGGITREYRLTCSKFQTYIPTNDDDIIQDGIHSLYRAFVGRHLSEFVDWVYMLLLSPELDGPEISVDQITR